MVVNAGGMAAPDIARLVGVTVPIIPMAHQYLVTEPFSPALEPLPTLRDPDNLVYFRTEVGGLVMGGYERDPAPFGLDGIPDGFEAQLLTEDWDRFEELMAGALRRVPAIEHAEVKRFFNGPEAFTPDGEFILGESEVPGFWVAAGFCAHGLAGAGGIGKVMAEWIVDGEPEYDLWHMDIRRFGRHYRSQRYALARTTEVYSQYYDIHYPGQEREAGRPLRVSAAYPRLLELGAAFGEKSGWERANWFEPNAARGDESLRPRGWAGRNWSPAIGAECLATRDAAALFDESSFAKIDVHGPGALAFLDGLCANADRPADRQRRVHAAPEPPGRHRVRSDRDEARRRPLPAGHGHRVRRARPRLAPPPPSRGRNGVRRRRHGVACLLRPVGAALARDPAVADEDRPRTRGVPLPARPRDRRRLRAVPGAARDLRRRARVRALLPDRVRPRAVGRADGGGRAARTRPRRLPRDRQPAPGEGLSRVVLPTSRPRRRPRPPGSASRCAWTRRRRSWAATRCWPSRLRGARSERLRCIALEDPWAVCLGGEPVRIDRETAGRVTTGGYGYRVERSIAYAYLPADAVPGATVEIDIFGELVTGTVVAEPLYDPENARIRA